MNNQAAPLRGNGTAAEAARGKERGTYEWIWTVFCNRLESEVRALDDGGVRMSNDGSGKETIHSTAPNAQASEGVPLEGLEWVLLRTPSGMHVLKKTSWWTDTIGRRARDWVVVAASNDYAKLKNYLRMTR